MPDPSYETVGWGDINELFERMITPLCRNNELAVFGEGSRIAEIGDILPGGTPTKFGPTTDRRRSRVIQGQGVAAGYLSEI